MQADACRKQNRTHEDDNTGVAFYRNSVLRVIPIELKISALSDLQTPRQQMLQFRSEDFAAHILQTSSFRTSEDPGSDLILCVRPRTYFDAAADSSKM